MTDRDHWASSSPLYISREWYKAIREGNDLELCAVQVSRCAYSTAAVQDCVGLRLLVAACCAARFKWKDTSIETQVMVMCHCGTVENVTVTGC
jgi:hypothetical protein